jgi:RNA polymerase sigma-70 factor, ECF subfamily
MTRQSLTCALSRPPCGQSPASVRLVSQRTDMVLEANVPRSRGVTGEPPPSEVAVTDQAILDALEMREPWAAAALYDKLSLVVERTIYRVLQRRGSDFEDLVQIAFERIVRTLVLRRFAANCKLTTWAAAIATNVAIDAVRAKIRERRVFSEQDAELVERESSPSGGSDCVEVRAEVVRVQRVLAAMNPEQAQAVFLHDAIGHNLAEVAVIAGVTVAAAQSRLVRGRKEFLRRARQVEMGGRTS